MARVFITGSSDGLGQLAAKQLIEAGHQVVVHARNAERGRFARDNVPRAENVLLGDLSSIEETRKLAADVNALGHFDAIIHNAGVYMESKRLTFAVNTAAPYILTCLINKPERLVYLSSGMHLQGELNFRNTSWDEGVSYADSKLHVVILSMAVARKWPDVYSNAVNPGWVPTKMGGRNAPGNLQKGIETQVWLAVSNDQQAKVSGHYFHHKRKEHYLSVANDVTMQEKFLSVCEHITGIRFPSSKSPL